MITKVINGIYLIVATCLIVSCANPVTPSGGPKDTEPPKFVKSEPPLYSRNFNEGRIKITFNEFIQLKDLNNQIIISPPMAILPDFKLKGKSVVIDFKDELLDNTTYNIFFGSAIVDLTENNPIENFQFIFSTGNVIDSLSIDGQLYNAFDLKPLKSINVTLYTNSIDTIPFDSLPYFVKPYYMTKTDEAGNFSLKNLADQPYKIFALSDMNGNLIYDQPGESIGFIEGTIFPTYKQPLINDTIVTDTLLTKTHTPTIDSSINYKIGLFQEIDSVQRLLKTTVPKKNQIIFIFKRPIASLTVNPLNLAVNKKWATVEYNPTKDTIIYWVNYIGKDSLKMEIIENKIIIDTINVALFKKGKGRKSELEDEKAKKLEVKNNLKSNFIDLNKPLILTFGYPIQSMDTAGIRLYENDSIPIKVAYGFVDSVNRKIKFEHKWKKATPYTLYIKDSTFVDILSHKNDSLLMRFTSRSTDDYGNLMITFEISNTGVNHVVQLISDDKVLREANLNKSERLSFTYLTPGKYTLKVIDDLNNNGKWDTGDYIYKIQPEKVRFFPTEIDVRPNWDIEEDWKL